ncbi:hypothetical protein [Mycobacterium sp. IDR2000157661]|uniref:hypothetical protein n=1 Tax=Mycobacterium sp. IDR2000157661 TaxID=2867005 RepID=UPI001EE9D3C1|nr:hypothetical protein [Mycobacterium sp. IDR2000157661]ULE35965.1 hypothetical protein K3G64_05350 [Mycobacterium sp. IDR2000157661]
MPISVGHDTLDRAGLLRLLRVCHLMHDGRLVAHAPSEKARLGVDGRIVWDR